MKRRTQPKDPRPAAGALPFWAWSTIAVFCTALYTASVPITSAVYDVDLPLSFTIATVQVGSLILAVFRPYIGIALQLGSVVALALATRASDTETWPLPVTGLISLGALVLLLGIRERWVLSVATWWVSIAVLVVVVVETPERYAVPDDWGTNLTIYASYTATVLVAAIALGQRRQIRADLARARRDVELEQAQRLFVEERARIARELHDVVAHSMSIIHMQALSAPFRLDRHDTVAVEREFGDIARSARSALAEMRQLLSALRPDDDDTALSPQPQLDDLDDLVINTARAGTSARLTIEPSPATPSSVIQLTIYRVVQEALSNVVRHASGATADVVVTFDSASARVSVLNAPPPTRSGRPAETTYDHGGQGLRGMRERVNLLGGHLATGPTVDGGYLVDVTLPLTPARRTETP